MRCGVGTLRWAVTDPSDVGPWLRASCCGILAFVALRSAVSAATAALDREAALRYVPVGVHPWVATASTGNRSGAWRSGMRPICWRRWSRSGCLTSIRQNPSAPSASCAACRTRTAITRRSHRMGGAPRFRRARRRAQSTPPLRGSGVGWACGYGWGLGQRTISTLHDMWVGLDAARLLDAQREDRS
jgi:hypothetical protein